MRSLMLFPLDGMLTGIVETTWRTASHTGGSTTGSVSSMLRSTAGQSRPASAWTSPGVNSHREQTISKKAPRTCGVTHSVLKSQFEYSLNETQAEAFRFLCDGSNKSADTLLFSCNPSTRMSAICSRKKEWKEEAGVVLIKGNEALSERRKRMLKINK